MRRDDDHQLGLFAPVFRTAEQRAQNRNITKPRHLVVQVTEIVLKQAGDGKAFTIPKLNRGLGFAAAEAVDANGTNVDTAVRVN